MKARLSNLHNKQIQLIIPRKEGALSLSREHVAEGCGKGFSQRFSGLAVFGALRGGGLQAPTAIGKSHAASGAANTPVAFSCPIHPRCRGSIAVLSMLFCFIAVDTME